MSVRENAIFAYFQIPQIVKRPAPPRPAPPKLDGTNTAPVPSPRKVNIKTCRKQGRLYVIQTIVLDSDSNISFNINMYISISQQKYYN